MEPWAFLGVPYMNPTILGCLAFGPGFLNQVPGLGFESIRPYSLHLAAWSAQLVSGFLQRF